MARENWDPEMLRFTEMMEARAAAQPPVKLELPLDNSRELNDGLSLPLAKGGAVMAESSPQKQLAMFSIRKREELKASLFAYEKTTEHAAAHGAACHLAQKNLAIYDFSLT